MLVHCPMKLSIIHIIICFSLLIVYNRINPLTLQLMIFFYYFWITSTLIAIEQVMDGKHLEER